MMSSFNPVEIFLGRHLTQSIVRMCGRVPVWPLLQLLLQLQVAIKSALALMPSPPGLPSPPLAAGRLEVKKQLLCRAQAGRPHLHRLPILFELLLRHAPSTQDQHAQALPRHTSRHSRPCGAPTGSPARPTAEAGPRRDTAAPPLQRGPGIERNTFSPG